MVLKALLQYYINGEKSSTNASGDEQTKSVKIAEYKLDTLPTANPA